MNKSEAPGGTGRHHYDAIKNRNPKTQRLTAELQSAPSAR
jgi:hypothetical protein